MAPAAMVLHSLFIVRFMSAVTSVTRHLKEQATGSKQRIGRIKFNIVREDAFQR